MKKRWMLLLVVALLCLSPLVACHQQEDKGAAVTTTTTVPEPDDELAHLTFTGKVLELDGDNVLMESYDKERFDTVWVNVAQTGIRPQVGEEYTVTYEDMMMPSLPPRITAVAMAPVSSTPTSSRY